VGLNNTGTPAATLYSASTSTGGASLLPIDVTASQKGRGIDLTGIMLARGASTVQNYTFRVATMSGSYRVAVKWGER
jgi:hypothetical protein